uniref:Uncharacterized protein n=1 Tax=Anguilla anguilla TaxID=7936 RepID=A0A0E9XII2_ANGAN
MKHCFSKRKLSNPCADYVRFPVLNCVFFLFLSDSLCSRRGSTVRDACRSRPICCSFSLLKKKKKTSFIYPSLPSILCECKF